MAPRDDNKAANPGAGAVSGSRSIERVSSAFRGPARPLALSLCRHTSPQRRRDRVPPEWRRPPSLRLAAVRAGKRPAAARPDTARPMAVRRSERTSLEGQSRHVGGTRKRHRRLVSAPARSVPRTGRARKDGSVPDVSRTRTAPAASAGASLRLAPSTQPRRVRPCRHAHQSPALRRDPRQPRDLQPGLRAAKQDRLRNAKEQSGPRTREVGGRRHGRARWHLARTDRDDVTGGPAVTARALTCCGRASRTAVPRQARHGTSPHSKGAESVSTHKARLTPVQSRRSLRPAAARRTTGRGGDGDERKVMPCETHRRLRPWPRRQAWRTLRRR